MPESCVKAKEEMEKSCISAQHLLLYGYKKYAPREHDQEEHRRQLINLRSDFRTPWHDNIRKTVHAYAPGIRLLQIIKGLLNFFDWHAPCNKSKAPRPRVATQPDNDIAEINP